MAVRGLPAELRRELERLPKHFEAHPSRLFEEIVVEVKVRGVPVTLRLDAAAYPAEPPRLELGEEWHSPLADRQGRIQDLTCLGRWNRTLGIGLVLRELEQNFRTTPPTRGEVRRRPRRSILKRLVRWLRTLFRRTGKDGGLNPDEVRARYEDLIEEKADRVLRYRQAVDNLVAQLELKGTRLTDLRREVAALETRRQTALEASREAVTALEAAGGSTEEIRHDANYQQGLATFQEATAALAEDRQEAREVEESARRLEELIAQHRGRLEELQESLDDLREEAADKVAELAATQIETEIHDAASGLSSHGFGEELAELRRQVEDIESSSRVARELSALEVSTQDREFLASGEAASAAATFDALLGLSASVDEGRNDSNRRQENSSIAESAKESL